MVMKKEKRGLLVVILVGFLIGVAGLLVAPQSGLAESPYSIRKAEPAKGSADETITFKAGKPKMVGSSQEEVKEKPALKVQKLIPAAKGKLKPAAQPLREVESKKPQTHLESVKQKKLIKPKLELQAEPMKEGLAKPKYKLQMEPMQTQMEAPQQTEVKVESLVPAPKENAIKLERLIEPSGKTR